jgi:LDH2 family malate/lactate/ureidoglycolate dehydrogenase
MSAMIPMSARDTARADYGDLVRFVDAVFARRGLPPARARRSAEALCYGDLTGHGSHGVANLARLYLPLLDGSRVDPNAELRVIVDLGAALLLDAQRALGLWVASEAMDMAVARAARHGVGLVSMRAATHFGCAGHHAAHAVRHGMVGLVAANCGRQRIARPPGGRVAMLGTNPLSIAAPAGRHHPFVLDMSTTAVAAGRVRSAATAGQAAPEGWLEDDAGRPVTDPSAFELGRAHLLWLGGSGPGGYKGFGLGLAVEVLTGILSGAGIGPEPESLAGDGMPSGSDDDIGVLAIAIAPHALRPGDGFDHDSQRAFDTILACPPRAGATAVRYPGWHEAERAQAHRRDGVPLSEAVWADLREVSRTHGIRAPKAASAA